MWDHNSSDLCGLTQRPCVLGPRVLRCIVHIHNIVEHMFTSYTRNHLSTIRRVVVWITYQTARKIQLPIGAVVEHRQESIGNRFHCFFGILIEFFFLFSRFFCNRSFFIIREIQIRLIRSHSCSFRFFDLFQTFFSFPSDVVDVRIVSRNKSTAQVVRIVDLLLIPGLLKQILDRAVRLVHIVDHGHAVVGYNVDQYLTHNVGNVVQNERPVVLDRCIRNVNSFRELQFTHTEFDRGNVVQCTASECFPSFTNTGIRLHLIDEYRGRCHSDVGLLIGDVDGRSSVDVHLDELTILRERRVTHLVDIVQPVHFHTCCDLRNIVRDVPDAQRIRTVVIDDPEDIGQHLSFVIVQFDPVLCLEVDDTFLVILHDRLMIKRLVTQLYELIQMFLEVCLLRIPFVIPQ